MHSKRSDAVHIEFVVITESPLPRGEQVFLSGSLPELGNWAADGLPLTRVEDLKWSGWLELPKNTQLEYKITRGTWEAEEAHEGPAALPNRRLTVRQDEVVTVLVKRWTDGLSESRPSA